MNTNLADKLNRKPGMAWVDYGVYEQLDTPGAGTVTLLEVAPWGPGEVLLFLSLENVGNTHTGVLSIETKVDSLSWTQFARLNMTLGVVQPTTWGFDLCIPAAGLTIHNINFAVYKKFYTDPEIDWRIRYEWGAGLTYALPSRYNFLVAPRYE